jgi:hypothetical protein
MMAEGRNASSGLFDALRLNESLCLSIDAHLDSLVDLRNDGWDSLRASADAADAFAYALPTGLLGASIVCLLYGGQLLKPTAATAAAVFVFYVVYMFQRSTGVGIGCETVLGVAGALALLAALATSCVLKLALFLTGAAATAAVVHLTYSMFPSLHAVGAQPTIAERSISYWGLMVLASVGGGLVVRWHSTPVLEALTACAGGAGLAYALHAFSALLNGAPVVDRRVFFGAGVGAAGVGLVFQRRRRRKRNEVVGARKHGDAGPQRGRGA